MGEVTTNYKVNVTVEDAKWQAYVKSVADVQAKFGGATKAAVESAQKMAASAEQLAAKEIASAKKAADAIEKINQKQAETALREMKREADADAKERMRAANARVKFAEQEEKAAKRLADVAEKAAQKQANEEIKAAQKAAAAIEKINQKQAENALREMKREADADAKERMKAANERVKFAKQEEAAAKKAAEAAERAAKKQADAEIKEAQRAADAIEKEEQKKQDYLLKLRMKSIQDANKAEEKAERERNKPKPQQQEKGGGGGLGAGLMGGIGFAAAIEGFKAIKHHAEEADHANDELHIGIAATGLQGKALAAEEKAQADNAKKFSEIYKGISEETAKSTIATVAEMSHKSGDELKSLSEDAIILAHGDAEKAAAIAKMLGKASNEEVEGSAAKLGIALDKNMTAEQRAAKIHEEAMKRKKSVQDADNDSLGSLQQIMNKVMSTVTTLAATILDAFKPAIDALIPVVTQIGELLVAILKPILDALVPIITMVAEAMAQLAPVIIDLVKSALEILMPIITDVVDILKELIPPIIEVVKTIMTALSPVFKALMPIIEEVAAIIKDIFITNADMMIDMLQNVLVPLIQDLVAPILLSLMPVFQLLADMARDILVPAMKVLSGIMSFLMVNVVQPLIRWLSGGLVKAIDSVIGVVTAAIKVISKVTDAIGSLLGLGGDEAVAQTKKAVTEVAVVQEEAQVETIKKVDEFHAKKTAKVKDNSNKERKSYIQQQQDLIDLDQQTYAQAIANLEKYYGTLKEKNLHGRKEVKDAIRKYETAAEDERMKEAELNLLKQGLNDEDFKEEKERLEIEHLQKMLDIAKENGHNVLEAQIALINAQISQQKRLDAERAEGVKRTNDEIAASNKALSEKSAQDAIDMAKGRKDNIDSMRKQAEFFAGPIVQGFTNGFKKIMKGAEDWASKMAESNNIVESIFGGILQGFISMIEGMIVKIIEFEALLLVANLIPGFGGLMEAMGGLGSLIPHGDGGIINHAEGGVGVSPVTIGRHRFFEAGPEAVIPLSSGRAQGMMSGAFGFDKALAPVVAGLSKIETHVAKTRTVLPMNDAFEGSRNNYLKSEDRRSL